MVTRAERENCAAELVADRDGKCLFGHRVCVTGEKLRGVISLVQVWSLETECVIGSCEVFM